MKVKKGQYVQTWNGGVASVLDTHEKKAHLLFSDGRRSWEDTGTITSAVDAYSEAEARFLQAKDRLAEHKTKKEKEAGVPKKWEPTVKKLKKHPEVDNPYALVNWMESQDYTPGGKESSVVESDRDRTPKYVVEITTKSNAWTSPMEWDMKRFGKPTEEKLNRYVDALNKSVMPGGVNEHVGEGGVIEKAIVRENIPGAAPLVSYGSSLKKSSNYPDKPGWYVYDKRTGEVFFEGLAESGIAHDRIEDLYAMGKDGDFKLSYSSPTGTASKKQAGLPNDFDTKYRIDDILIPVDGDPTDQIYILDVHPEDKKYVVERRPLPKDKNPDPDSQTYGVRYEVGIKELDGDKKLRIFSSRNLTRGCPREVLSISKKGQNVCLCFPNGVVAEYSDDGDLRSTNATEEQFSPAFRKEFGLMIKNVGYTKLASAIAAKRFTRKAAALRLVTAGVVVFDNGGETFDRYTIVDTNTGEMYGASDDPYNPQGFGQYGGDIQKSTDEPGKSVADYIQKAKEDPSWLGKEVSVDSLPEPVQKYVAQVTTASTAAKRLTRKAAALRPVTAEEDVFKRHQKKIALDTLRMSDVGANIMGGMTKDDARSFLKSIGYSDEQIQKVEASKKEVKGTVAFASPTFRKMASLKKKADRLGNYEFDVHGEETWKLEAGDDGKKKLVRIKQD